MNKKKSALINSVIALLLCISMLVGTTFAWFTDSVTTGINTIAAGNLDVELYHSNAAVSDEQVDSNTKLFMDLQGKPILWEPGVVSYENLHVTNAGDLALAYQMAISTANENYVVEPSGEKYGLSQILKVGFVEGGITATDRAGVVASVAAANWTNLSDFLRGGSLLPEGAGRSEQTWGVVIYWEPGENDNRWNLNNGKQLNEGVVLNIELGIKLIATQEMIESDSFDKEYDHNAKAEFFAGFQGGSAGAAVTVNEQGATAAKATMSGGDVSAEIPEGVQVAEGVSALSLAVTMKDASEANIQLSDSEEMRPLDVHIEGVADGNTTPMLVTLKHYLSTGINTGALRLYHVENGATVAMTQVATPANHNEFSYDPATGDVTLALASFSEVAVIADNNNPWDGKTLNYLWYDDSATELTIYNADQLAGFAAIVDGKAEGIKQDSFAGQTVKLNNNITLNGKNFDPIGWGYVNSGWNSGDAAGKVFMGTFDGNGKTISDLYQNGWELEEANGTDYTYTNCGFGLFAAASGATFQNLTIYGADIKAECVEMGVLVGLSQNDCSYNNIGIHNAKIANYQRPAGGLIGEVSGEGTTTITGVTIGSDVVVGSLWGDFDAPCGGVIGARWDDVGKDPKIVMTNVEVGARMDVYSDVTAAYQWHAYRRAGMLIGNTDIPAADGRTAKQAEAPFLTCTGVKVYYGDWAAYHYCEFTNDNNPGKGYPWVRVEAGENNPAYSNPRYGHPVDESGNTVTNGNHAHKAGDTCGIKDGGMELRFNQLYGGGQGVYGQPVHDGVEVINYRYSITYINDGQVLAIKYVTENGAVPVENKAAQDLVEEWATENIKDYTWKFGGWMNAGSTKLTSIDANNKENIVLYPYFDKPYTASFVDQHGNILAWCFFFENEPEELEKARIEAEKLMPYPSDEFKLDYWMVDINGGVEYAKATFNTYKQDVTIYPVFKYDGDVQLIPVDDDNDGATNYYKVAGYSNPNGQNLVKIPGEVLGIKVTQINAGAFSSYDGVHSIVVPSTVTYIGDYAFAKKGANESVTIYYTGSYDEWREAEPRFASNWEGGVSSSTKIFFLNGGNTVDVSQGYLQASVSGLFTKIVSWKHKTSITSALIEEYSGKCDCKTCKASNLDRPDAGYWVGVTAN